MDSLLVEGIAATISAILVFCGSVWLLLALVLGPRLAYFITASVTLGFLLLMGAVWSVGEPLGPVGEVPSWTEIGVAETAAEIQFGPAQDYPEGPWAEPSEDDAEQGEFASAAEGEAPDALAKAIEDGDVTAFTDVDEASVDSDGTRLLLQGDDVYAAVRFQVAPAAEEGDTETDAASDEDITPEEGDSPAEDDAAAAEEEEGPAPDAEAFVILERHPGNPLLMARQITAGTFVLFVLHLLGLSWSEKRAKRVP
ncbi:MAG TPA: hypothetical protein VG318_00525 [Actinomycetota bacterium]|nr:hypothetical protein [Actinomycetota bacterium]